MSSSATLVQVLVTGAAGQVGRALQATVPDGVTLHAMSSTGLDITDTAAVQSTIDRLRPDVIINAAAYTAVDRAESEPELAFRVNRDGAANLAMAGSRQGARMIHLSTDYVFDGKQDEPYAPNAMCNPLGVYGASKRAGEEAVLKFGGQRATVVRTSWVYSSTGTNFVRTMLRLMAERDELRVVDDQVGRPTWAGGLAEALWSMAIRPASVDIAHWTDEGVTTWHGLAEATLEGALERGLLTRRVDVHAIPTVEFPTPAPRPRSSVLDISSARAVFGREPAHWRDTLSLMLEELCRAA